MTQIRYQGRSYPAAEGESVLDTLLRHQVPVAHSCRAGACQACLLRTSSSSLPPAAQAGLKQTLKEQGYFLACQLHPREDLEVLAPGEDCLVSATIRGLFPLSPSVLKVSLQATSPFDYRPGQYLTLLRGDGLARSYSLASLPEEGLLELHVRLIPGGAMSGWLAESARVGDLVGIRGPAGECFYTAGAPKQPLLLAGTGTGLAPLYGIIRDALRRGHTGPIRLFHGAVDPSGLYLREELQALAAEHSSFTYQPCVLQGDADEKLQVGPIDQIVLQSLPKLQGWRAFVCGDPALVKTLKKRFFLAGAALKEIHADAFLPSAVPAGIA